jgi:hypothetical protein
VVQKIHRLLAQEVTYRYDKARQLNITVHGRHTRPFILVRSSLSMLKTVQKDVRGED